MTLSDFYLDHPIAAFWYSAIVCVALFNLTERLTRLLKRGDRVELTEAPPRLVAARLVAQPLTTLVLFVAGLYATLYGMGSVLQTPGGSAYAVALLDALKAIDTSSFSGRLAHTLVLSVPFTLLAFSLLLCLVSTSFRTSEFLYCRGIPRAADLDELPSSNEPHI